MKKVIKGILCLIVCAGMFHACNLNYICDIVDSIPEDVYMRILDANPGISPKEMAKIYLAQRDSIEAEISAETEYEIFLSTLKYEEDYAEN